MISYLYPKFGDIIYHAALYKGLRVVDNSCSPESNFKVY